MNYIELLEAKRHTLGSFGFDPVWMPDRAFDFQKAIIEKAVRKGRIGVFADTGLGKTLIQLSCAYNIVMKTNGRVLILTPLAVAFQFIAEADKIGIELKDSYYKQAIINLEHAATRFDDVAGQTQDDLFA